MNLRNPNPASAISRIPSTSGRSCSISISLASSDASDDSSLGPASTSSDLTASSFCVSVSLEAKDSSAEEVSTESYDSALSRASAARASSGTSDFFIFTATFLALVALAGATASPASLVFDLALLAVVVVASVSETFVVLAVSTFFVVFVSTVDSASFDFFVVFLAFVATADFVSVLFFSFSIVPPGTIAPHCHLSLIRSSRLWSQSGSLVAS